MWQIWVARLDRLAFLDALYINRMLDSFQASVELHYPPRFAGSVLVLAERSYKAACPPCLCATSYQERDLPSLPNLTRSSVIDGSFSSSRATHFTDISDFPNCAYISIESRLTRFLLVSLYEIYLLLSR